MRTPYEIMEAITKLLHGDGCAEPPTDEEYAALEKVLMTMELPPIKRVPTSRIQLPIPRNLPNLLGPVFTGFDTTSCSDMPSSEA